MSEEQGDEIERALAYLKGEMAEADRTAFEEELADSEGLRDELERARALLDTLEASNEGAIIRQVNTIIVQALQRGASDIHVVPERRETLVLVRVDGHLQELTRFDREGGLHGRIVGRWKVMADCALNERHVPQDGRIPIRHDGRDYDLSVSILPTLYGERVRARIAGKSSVLLGLDRLGLSAAQQAALRRMARRPSGLILAGRANSGATTLLYSLLEDVRSGGPRRNILTVEDPVEYQLGGVSQTGVNRQAGLTFAGLLRSLSRQDADVVLVGEMREQETAESAVELAFTGHLVLSPLNVSSALQVIPHLRDMGIARHLVAQTLVGAVGQRLVRRVCPACAADDAPPPDDLEKLGLSPSEDGPFKRGAGCDACFGTGYKGRVGLFEVLEVEEPLRRRIAEDAPAEVLWRESFGRSGGSLRDDAREKVRQGLTTVEEAVWALFDYPHMPVFPPAQSVLFPLRAHDES